MFKNPGQRVQCIYLYKFYNNVYRVKICFPNPYRMIQTAIGNAIITILSFQMFKRKEIIEEKNLP